MCGASIFSKIHELLLGMHYNKYQVLQGFSNFYSFLFFLIFQEIISKECGILLEQTRVNKKIFTKIKNKTNFLISYLDLFLKM